MLMMIVAGLHTNNHKNPSNFLSYGVIRCWTPNCCSQVWSILKEKEEEGEEAEPIITSDNYYFINNKIVES
jgi:hypothetical protein